jgi:hypothetical protein
MTTLTEEHDDGDIVDFFAACWRDELGALLQRAELRQARAREAAAVGRRDEGRLDRVTVPELARQIGQSEGATRRLLRQELIPGAHRMDPLNPRSPFLIPADAGEQYLRLFEKGR